MKILLVLDDFPPVTYTGQSIVAYNLAQGLLRSGHEVIVITSVQNKLMAGYSIYDGIGVYRIFSDYNDRFHDIFYHYISIYNPQIIPQFKRLIAEIRPDVCHFHNVHGYMSYYCFKLARKHSRGVFLTAHDLLLVSYGKMWPKNGNCLYRFRFWDNLLSARKRYNPFRNLFIRHYLRYVDKIFCISQGQNEILQLNGIKKTETIYNAINTNEWLASAESVGRFKEKYNLLRKKIVLFGARLSEAKGGEAIIRAMSIVAKAVPDAVLVVVGKSDGYADQMMDLAKADSINQKIIFTDWLSREEICSAFFAANVCVTPSIYFDPFNLFNIESMAASKPVVGTCYGGTPEIVVDGVTGYIVDPLKIDIFADKIIELLNNHEMADMFGQSGHQRVIEYFSIGGQVEETLKQYDSFINV